MVSVPLDEPRVAVEDTSFLERVVAFDGFVVPNPEELSDGSDDVFGGRVTLRFADEGRARRNAEEGKFLLEEAALVSGTVIVAGAEAAGDPWDRATEMATDAQGVGFESREAIGTAGGVETDRVRGTVTHGDEDGSQTVQDGVGGGVGSAHDIRGVGGDGFGMGPGALFDGTGSAPTPSELGEHPPATCREEDRHPASPAGSATGSRVSSERPLDRQTAGPPSKRSIKNRSDHRCRRTNISCLPAENTHSVRAPRRGPRRGRPAGPRSVPPRR